MKDFIPELSYWFSKYWKSRGELSIVNINLDALLQDEDFFNNRSFIKLLFSEIFEEDSYLYGFEKKSISILRKGIVSRLNTLKDLPSIVVCTEEGEMNYFELQDPDLVMLDYLLLFRQEYGITGSFGIDGIDFEDLYTNLSKLIYIYLDVIVNNRTTYVPYITDILERSSLLEKMFCFYVMNECHKVIKNFEFLVNNKTAKLRLIRKTFLIDDDILQNKKVELEILPFDINGIIMYVNDILYMDFNKRIENDKLIIEWSDTFEKDNYINIDYHTEILENID